MSSTENVLPRDVVIRLGDHKYEKRKAAALEIEHLIRDLLAQQNEHQVRAILQVLGSEFMNNSSPNYRKGGLIGLAACALGLMDSAHRFMDLLIDPVLKCFEDPESRVRYYACESMYNIAKVVRGKVLDRFNYIFDGLCKLSVDVNIDVKNGAILLDGLMKDIVTETPTFQIETFIPLLKKYITKTNPHVRQLLVNWITALDAVPDIDMLVWLPTFLDGLFNMLSDVNRLIRNTADSALSDFLKELKRTTSVEFGPCNKSERGMVATLVMHCKSKNILARITAILWIKEFVLLGKEQLVPHYGELLEAILAGTGHQEEEIRTTTAGANSVLMDLVERTTKELDLSPLLERLTLHLVNENESTRMTSHRWICMLLEKCPNEMNACVDDYFFALLRTLEDSCTWHVVVVCCGVGGWGCGVGVWVETQNRRFFWVRSLVLVCLFICWVVSCFVANHPTYTTTPLSLSFSMFSSGLHCNHVVAKFSIDFPRRNIVSKSVVENCRIVWVNTGHWSNFIVGTPWILDHSTFVQFIKPRKSVLRIVHHIEQQWHPRWGQRWQRGRGRSGGGTRFRIL